MHNDLWSHVLEKLCHLLGLDYHLYSKVREVVEIHPPLVREVFPALNEDVRERNFGYRKHDFPWMCDYVARAFGVDGVRCLVLHFLAIHIRRLVKRGYDADMIGESSLGLLHDYIRECRRHDFKHIRGNVVEELIRDILGRVSTNLDAIVDAISSHIKASLSPAMLLVNSALNLLAQEIRINLISMGYGGYKKRRGLRVDGKAFSKAFGIARRLLREEIEAAMSVGKILHPEEIISKLNKAIRKLRGKSSLTLDDYRDMIEKLSSEDPEMKKFLEIIRRVAKSAVELYHKNNIQTQQHTTI